MKYMFTCTPIQTQVTPKQRLELLKATKKWIDQRVKNGTIEVVYNFIEYGGLSIANLDSPEAARDYLADFPARQLFDWQVTPLLEHKKAIDGSIARLKKALKKK
ncbi:DUF3303 family protein [Thermodesulfobacteriota bacterium]